MDATMCDAGIGHRAHVNRDAKRAGGRSYHRAPAPSRAVAGEDSRFARRKALIWRPGSGLLASMVLQDLSREGALSRRCRQDHRGTSGRAWQTDGRRRHRGYRRCGPTRRRAHWVAELPRPSPGRDRPATRLLPPVRCEIVVRGRVHAARVPRPSTTSLISAGRPRRPMRASCTWHSTFEDWLWVW